ILTIITVSSTYYCAICMIIGNLLVPGWSYMMENSLSITDGVFMITQVTLQTFLIQSANRKTNSLRQVFAFLIFANLGMWTAEVKQISVKMELVQHADLQMLPPILMSLNRFYSALLFLDFWKTK